MKELEFKDEMMFLKKAYRYGLREIERELNRLQVEETELDKYLNTSFNLDSIIKASQFMKDAERRTVKLYRTHNKLD